MRSNHPNAIKSSRDTGEIETADRDARGEDDAISHSSAPCTAHEGAARFAGHEIVRVEVRPLSYYNSLAEP